MKVLCETLAFVILIAFLFAIAFVFTGEPNLWDKWHMEMMK